MPRADLRLDPEDDGTLLPAVKHSLDALRKDPSHKHSVDRGMRRLAMTYARAIDDAEELSHDARELVRQAVEDELEGIEIAKRTLNALVKFSDGRMVLNDLGPRLQSVLETLGASPKARAAMTGSRGGKPDDDNAKPPAAESPLEKRRRLADEREHAARKHNATAVDPSA